LAKREPSDILEAAFKRASAHLDKPLVNYPAILGRIESVCSNRMSRACDRLLLSCLLAKIEIPEVDIRKPYTEIGGDDCFSGRSYDEEYVGSFVRKHNLPCNTTTAFLTPAFRAKNVMLTVRTNLGGRPKEVYKATLRLLSDVEEDKVSANTLLAEVIRNLLIIRDERKERMHLLIKRLKARGDDILPLSSEAIVSLIQQHLASPKSSRLPVLVVAAAYQAAEKYLKERMLPLYAHTAADKQTGALGDLEITLVNDDAVVTSYEMKDKRVTRGDIDIALGSVVWNCVKLMEL